MSKKEEFSEIFQLLKDVAAHRGQPILDSEIREITKRLFEYRQGGELYSAIMAISTAKYFPSGCELERQIREAKGLKPLKGLTPELIDKFEEECIVSGQSVKNARAGAEISRRTLRKDPQSFSEMLAPKVEQIKAEINDLANGKDVWTENAEILFDSLGPIEIRIDDFDKVTTISVDEELDKF